MTEQETTGITKKDRKIMEIMEEYNKRIDELQKDYFNLTGDFYKTDKQPIEISNNGEELPYKYDAIVEYVINKMEKEREQNEDNRFYSLIEDFKDKRNYLTPVYTASNINHFKCYKNDAVFVRYPKGYAPEKDYNIQKDRNAKNDELDTKRACEILSQELGYEVAHIRNEYEYTYESSQHGRIEKYTNKENVHTFVFANNKEKLKEMISYLKYSKITFPYNQNGMSIEKIYDGKKDIQSVKYIPNTDLIEKDKYKEYENKAFIAEIASYFCDYPTFSLHNIEQIKKFNQEERKDENYKALIIETSNQDKLYIALNKDESTQDADFSKGVIESKINESSRFDINDIKDIKIINSKEYEKELPKELEIHNFKEKIINAKEKANKELEEIRNTKQNTQENTKEQTQTKTQVQANRPKPKSRGR